MRLSPLLLLVAGCSTSYLTVDRQPGFEGSWSFDSSSLDVSGSTATLTFAGRLFVFEGVSWMRGRMEKHAVILNGEKLRIRADEERIWIREGGRTADVPLSTLPAGARFVWQDGRLNPR